ncbi:MAG: hypothetical protein PHU99_03515 [Candidatus Cloacimonetes bacterium]|nr:hypothetical protein [Candidatus Cloacimonadota bacterium]MDY0336895.1 hypothetical protein [Candidatus Cloacimonadaceae bacterium]MCK9334403.1 hypothetical protein [Candidatus Cloacimonadota bacterium]MDD3096763.1 hypothetical protein [Candidatus Cloacimonadota bacterium]MDD4034615.1 hypothetical protein [Candidatus Cloacimonadota bacterium]
MKRLVLSILMLAISAYAIAIDDRFISPLATVKQNQAFSIAVDEGNVLVRNQYQMWVYSTFNAWQPRLEGSFSSLYPIEDVNIQGGNQLYVSSHEPTNTVTAIDSLNTYGRIFFTNPIIGDKMTREGSTLYVADRFRGIDIFDIGNGVGHDLKASFAEKWGIRDFVAQYPYIYALNDFGVVVVDVSQQNFPLGIATNYQIPDARCLVKDREYLYVAAGKELLVISIRDNDKPLLVAQVRLANEIQSLAIKDQRLFAALGQGGVKIYDVSIPNRLEDINTFYPPAAAYDIALENDYVYVALGRDGWIIYEYK